jgi:hypothetical protein
MKNVGLGRVACLRKPTKLKEIVSNLKSHLRLKAVRIAIASGKTLGFIFNFL